MEKEPVLLERYRQDLFADYVFQKYKISNQQHLKDSRFLKLVYALQWYQIPKHAVWDLIEFHPDITRDDYKLLQQCTANHKIENAISVGLFSLVCNRLLRKSTAQSDSFFRHLQKRAFRWPVALGFAIGLDFFFNYFVLRSVYYGELQSFGLDKYLVLGLDAERMRSDLKQDYGVDINPVYYSAEAEQAQVQAQAAREKLEEQKKKEVEAASRAVETKAKAPE